MAVSQPLIRTLLPCLTAIFLISACGSGSRESSDVVFGDAVVHGSGPDAGGDAFDVTPPAVTILFPPASALTGADSVTVTGTATDATTIASITVNGVRATSDDDFLSWRARVPLDSGANTLEVTSADRLGNRDTAAATTVVINNPAFAAPQSIALDSTNNRLLVIDSTLAALFTLDPVSGQRDILSGPDVGQGPSLGTSFGLAVDDANNRAFVVDPGRLALIAVDLATGDRSIVSNASTGAGTPFTDPDSVALDLANNRALVTELVTGTIYAVDLASGDRTLLTNIGSGDPLTFPVAITVDATNNRALVVDVRSMDAAVVEIDLTTGDRSVLSGPGVGIGPDLEAPGGIAIDPGSGEIIVSDSDLNALLSIDPGNGNRTELSSSSVGGGDPFAFPLALVVDDASRSFVVDATLNTVFAVDNSNGDRSTLSDAGIGTGPEFTSPFSIAIDRANNQALVSDRATGALYGVNISTGERRVISDAANGTGQPLIFPASVALQTTTSSAIVVDANAPAVVSIDLASGDRSVISNPGSGGGDPFVSPLGGALDNANRRLVVTNPDNAGDNAFLLGIDLATGDRSVLSRGDVTSPAAPAIGTGSAFGFPQNIAVDSSNQVGYVVDTLLDSVVVVDLNTGDRSTGPVGGGADFPPITNEAPGGIVPVQDISLAPGEAVVSDSNQRSVYGFDTTSGARRVISDPTVGVGSELQGPVSIAFDSATGTVFVVDGALFAVLAIEAVSGDRVIVSR